MHGSPTSSAFPRPPQANEPPQVDPLVAAALAHGRSRNAPRLAARAAAPRQAPPPAYWASGSAHGLPPHVSRPAFTGDGYGKAPQRHALVLDAHSGEVVRALSNDGRASAADPVAEARDTIQSMGFFGDGVKAAPAVVNKRDVQLRGLLAFFGFWLIMSALFLFFYLDRYA